MSSVCFSHRSVQQGVSHQSYVNQRKAKEPVQAEALVSIPKIIKEHYMELTIVADVLHANQILFSARFPVVFVMILSVFCFL